MEFSVSRKLILMPSVESKQRCIFLGHEVALGCSFLKSRALPLGDCAMTRRCADVPSNPGAQKKHMGNFFMVYFKR